MRSPEKGRARRGGQRTGDCKVGLAVLDVGLLEDTREGGADVSAGVDCLSMQGACGRGNGGALRSGRRDRVFVYNTQVLGL